MKRKKLIRLTSAWLVITVLTPFSVMSQEQAIQKYIESSCFSCHAFKKPDFEALGIDERINRKGPHLYYAGDKFNREWLETWLKEPYRMRPAGSYPPDHTVVEDVGDVIDESSLSEHISVPEDIVAAVADYLMSLKMENPPTLETQYKQKKVSAVMGRMNFHKFKGCAACHRDAPDIGGLSGPELYTAWKRLNPQFFISYIKQPTAWDPHSMMPNRHLDESDIHKLVDYLREQGE